MQRISKRQSQIAENLADIGAARRCIVDEVRPHRDRLCMKLIEKRARAAIARDLPTHKSLQQNPVHTTTFNATSLIAKEQADFDAMITSADNDGLMKRYPVRETGALTQVAVNLGFKNRSKYEAAVRKLIIEDDDARNNVLQILNDLTIAINT